MRVNLGKSNPNLYQTVAQLEKLCAEAASSAGIKDGFVCLLKLRASQMNGCSFCVRMHSRDAVKAGESADRIALVSAWRESHYFEPRERAALSLVEAITDIGHGQVSDSVYEEAAAVLGAGEIAAIEWIAIVINVWNRIALSSRYPVEP